MGYGRVTVGLRAGYGWATGGLRAGYGQPTGGNLHGGHPQRGNLQGGTWRAFTLVTYPLSLSFPTGVSSVISVEGVADSVGWVDGGWSEGWRVDFDQRLDKFWGGFMIDFG